MDYKALSHQIVERVGGAENIESAAHCATRLRLVLKDNSKFDEAGIKGLEGVINILKTAGQFQIIIGPNVKEVYDELVKGNVGGDIKATGKKFVLKDAVLSAAQFMGACVGPAIIPMIGAGLIKAFLTVFVQFGWLATTNNTYTILYMASDAIRVFMPVFIAVGAARKLNCNEILATLMACIMISPAFVSLVGAGNPLTVFGIPIPLTDYSGSFLPIILTVVVMSLVEKLLRKIIPSGAQMLLVPFLIVLIMTPIALCATGPVSVWISEIIAKPIIALADYGWIVVTILAACMPLLIMFGLHGVIISFLIVTFYIPLGYEPYFMVASLCAHLAIGTVCLAVGLKSKKSAMKTVAFTSGTTMLFGNISEPAIFGVLLQSPTALASAMIAGGIAGLYAGITGIKCFVLAGASWLFVPCFIGEGSSIVNVLITCAISTVIAFVLAMLLYKDPKTVVAESENNQTVSAK